MVKSSSFISNETRKVISYHISRVSIGMLAATGVAALGGLALQQLGGVGGLSSGVQGLLSQESSGPQIATRSKKINVHISRSVLGTIYFSGLKSGLVHIGDNLVSAQKKA